MLKYLAILVAVIVVVQCDGGFGPPPAGECKNCNNSIGKVFEMVAAMAKGMEPIEIMNASICKKAILTIGPSTMTTHGKTCMISEPSPSKNKWQMCGFKLLKLHLECHIIPLAEVGSLVGLNIPVPPKIPGFGSTSEVHQIIVIDGKNLCFDFNSIINFEEDSCNMTKLEMAPGQMNDVQLHLEGDSFFTGLGETLTKPEVIRSAIGFVIQFILRTVIGQFIKFQDSLKEVITMLNCGDTDY